MIQRGTDNRHASFVEIAKKGDIDVLFLGDSITDFWRTTGKAVWEKYYGNLKAANFGISADRTQHVLWRLQNGEGQGFKPKVVVLMIGTNNTGMERGANPVPRNTVPETIEGVYAVVAELRKDFPDAKILLLAIFPRFDSPINNPQIAEINQALVKLNDLKHVFYLDIGDKFLNDDKSGFKPGVFNNDKLHPAAPGYEIWAESIQEPLTLLLKP
jgi:lysophospholipase L1-like esterase